MLTIDNLPIELVDYIKDYIPPTTLVWLNKKNYLLYNEKIRGIISDNRFEDYIRDMVRQNNIFVMKHIINENIHRWIKLKRWRYKNIIYFDYIHFVYNYATRHQSFNCRDLMDEIATQLFGEKWHKKNGIKYIRRKWIN
jgi:hypothetical protein